MNPNSPPSRPFRLIDSGVADGRWQIAYDAALTDLHERGQVPDTVRFLRFPPSVLVGRHQILHSEVHVERCREEGVGLVRRVSGGGAIYLDETQVGWELVMHRRTLGLGTLAAHATAICEAVAHGLEATFGIPARFRPRNDIEVDGRKISGTGGFFAGDTLVYQGTVLVDMDGARMARLLNIPATKLARHGAEDGGARVVTLKALLGRAPAVADVHEAILSGLRERLGITTEASEPTPEEIALTQHWHDSEIGTDAFVDGSAIANHEDVLEARRETSGGTIQIHLRLEGASALRRIREIQVSGDFFVAPPRAIYDLEAALRGVGVAELATAIAHHFESHPPEIMSMTTDDIAAAILDAIRRDGTETR